MGTPPTCTATASNTTSVDSATQFDGVLVGNPHGIVHKLGAPCSSLHGPDCSTVENKTFFVKLWKAEVWTPRTKPDSEP